jgi:hypothetical protein
MGLPFVTGLLSAQGVLLIAKPNADTRDKNGKYILLGYR